MTSLKRAVISAASALGIKPVDRAWVAALTSLNGSFERTGWELRVAIAPLVFIAGIVMTFAWFGVEEYRHSGWTLAALFIGIYCLGMSCLLFYLVSRAGMRYVFGAGTVNAYNTWGRLSWTEDLTGLKDVILFSGRGGTAMTLYWPERKRTLVLFNSLKGELDASLERLRPSAEPESVAEIKVDAGPPWSCPHCHEENPGNFEECWKCLKDRATEVQ